MGYTLFKAETLKAPISSVATTQNSAQATPKVVSKNDVNQLTPFGPVVPPAVGTAPNTRTLNNTGTAINTPTPVG